jgi:hypothetical protein
MPVTCHFDGGPLAGTTYTMVGATAAPAWMRYALLPGRMGDRWTLDWARVGGSDLPDDGTEPWPNEVRYEIDRVNGEDAFYLCVSDTTAPVNPSWWQVIVNVHAAGPGGEMTVGRHAMVLQATGRPEVTTTVEVVEVPAIHESEHEHVPDPVLDPDWRRGGAEPAGPGRWTPND